MSLRVQPKRVLNPLSCAASSLLLSLPRLTRVFVFTA